MNKVSKKLHIKSKTSAKSKKKLYAVTIQNPPKRGAIPLKTIKMAVKHVFEKRS